MRKKEHCLKNKGGKESSCFGSYKTFPQCLQDIHFLALKKIHHFYLIGMVPSPSPCLTFLTRIISQNVLKAAGNILHVILLQPGFEVYKSSLWCLELCCSHSNPLHHLCWNLTLHFYSNMLTRNSSNNNGTEDKMPLLCLNITSGKDNNEKNKQEAGVILNNARGRGVTTNISRGILSSLRLG